MPVIKNQFPILEYDTEKTAVIQPTRHGKPKLPKRCVMTFFGDVLENHVVKSGAAQISYYESEVMDYPIYQATVNGKEICFVQAPVGSASISTMTDYLIGYGVQGIIACGSCGVLEKIPAGDVIIPIEALRDEGASYHYLPPARSIVLDQAPIAAMKKVLEKHHTPYLSCKTWTTDAFYRETPDMITYRKKEGCRVVEMECSALASVARFRGIQFGQFLYSGDLLADFAHYDERDWSENLTAREKLFLLAVDAVCELEFSC